MTLRNNHFPIDSLLIYLRAKPFTKLVVMLFVILFVLTAEVQSRGTKKNPCGRGQKPLSNVFCGRGPTRQDCPSGYQCIIAPDDSYAVCCPVDNTKKTTTTTTNAVPVEKPGSCPPPSTLAGICLAECDDDSSCPDNQKCCGSCPRRCVSPVWKTHHSIFLFLHLWNFLNSNKNN